MLFRNLMIDVGMVPESARHSEKILRERICERCQLQPEETPLRINLILDLTLTAECFAIRTSPEEANAEIRGGDLLGLLYGIGAFLRNLSWHDEGFDCPDFTLTDKPDKRLRMVYAAGHFFNFWHMAPETIQNRYLEDLALWGANAIMVMILPAIDFNADWENPELLRHIEKMSSLVRSAARIGLQVGTICCANQAYRDVPRELLAQPNSHPLRGNNGQNVCPAKPGGTEYLVGNLRSFLSRIAGLPLTWWLFWPYDEGGCTCPECAPWGGNGFLRLSRAMAEEIKTCLPGIRFGISSWTFTPEEFDMLKMHLEESPWCDWVLADAHGDFPRWPLENDLPVPLVTFPEISMWGLCPWGGYGATPLPRHFSELWNQSRHRVDGCCLYSEGIFEDINKVLELQFYWGNHPAEETLKAYAAYELPNADPAEFVRLCQLLEADHIQNPQNNPVPPERPIEALRLAEKITSEMLPSMRNAWRWRLVYLRAVLDHERLVSGNDKSEVAENAYRELIRLYHLPPFSEELGPMHKGIRPPLYD